MTNAKPENFKFSRRPATTQEIESIGFKVEGEQAKSAKTGAWYACENFMVSNSATVDGEQRFGQFIYLDDDMPAAEDVLSELNMTTVNQDSIMYLYFTIDKFGNHQPDAQEWDSLCKRHGVEDDGGEWSFEIEYGEIEIVDGIINKIGAADDMASADQQWLAGNYGIQDKYLRPVMPAVAA